MASFCAQRHGGAEYPCVKRLRLRRLYSFLDLQGFYATANAMLGESDAVFSPTRLQGLVARGQWQDARSYLSRFLQLDRKRPTSVEALVLHVLLQQHKSLAELVAATGRGEKTTGPRAWNYLNHDRKTYLPGAIRIRSIKLNIFCSQHVRDSIDWDHARSVAADHVLSLAYRVPELRDKIAELPDDATMDPHEALPIAQYGYHPKKKATRTDAPALVKHYRRTLRRLRDSSYPSQESYDERRTLSKALHWVADIIDDCLKAAKRTMYPLEMYPRETETSGTKGATADSFSQKMVNSSECPVVNPWVPSMASAGASATTAPVPPMMIIRPDDEATAGASATTAPVSCPTNDMILMLDEASLAIELELRMFKVWISRAKLI
ncbi:hypothetical protein U9M48_032516 [Paspalum notatum var. saurae]|uniref:Uncharacterized protein n=1 Tax=Paspalum notatum var. saurae TaxID=547442 RepID=A0AAQ3X5H5_PASNO